MQTVVDTGIEVILNNGDALTVTVLVAVLVQPFDDVPVTVYVVVVVGVNAIPFVMPPDHAYVLAPLAVKVTGKPEHTVGVVGLDVIDKDGKAFTVTIFVAVFTQPFALVPVTV